MVNERSPPWLKPLVIPLHHQINTQVLPRPSIHPLHTAHPLPPLASLQPPPLCPSPKASRQPATQGPDSPGPGQGAQSKGTFRSHKS